MPSPDPQRLCPPRPRPVQGARLPAEAYAAPGRTAAVGAKDRLKFYWAINGTATWHAETVAGKGSVR